jgi:hypothetical protein
MFFLTNQHQAMLFLQGILFGTISVVLVGNFPKLSKTVLFTKVLVFAEKLVSFFCKTFTFS